MITSLQLLGIDVIDRYAPPAPAHYLLIPKAAHLRGNYVLQWSEIDIEPRDPVVTGGCLWDLIQLAGHESEDVWRREVLGLVERWGLLAGPPFWYDYEREYRGPGEEDIALWWGVGDVARACLQTLVATEAGDLVSAEVLELLEWGTGPRRSQSLQATPTREALDLPHTRIRDLFRRPRDRFDASWRPERYEGRGPELQRYYLLEALRGWPSSEVEIDVVWDDRGRRVEAVAYGVWEIIWAHLRSIFAAPQIDVYVCSVCGTPFPFAEGEGRRRPRTGAQRFCSQQCREAARRETNRVAWHRHKNEWRATREG